MRKVALCVVLLMAVARAASAAEIVIVDARSSPESLTVAPGGVLIVGSASTPFIYKVLPGSTTAEKFVDISAEGPGNFFLGVFADAGSSTLWACQVTVVPGPPAKRLSALRAFDLSSGAPKLRWDLPSDNANCNDFAVMPDKTLYFSDTFNSRIYKLAPGASTPTLFLEDRALYGIDGITLLNGALYVNTVFSNNLYRIPLEATGRPGRMVEIWMDQPVKGADGMRAANGKLLLAENGSGKISVLTITGDKATVTVIKEGLQSPTAVEPAGDVIWIADRAAGKAVSIPMPK